MRTIKLTIEYDGSRFMGWQVQAGRCRTVQALLERAAGHILSHKVRITGSGRTDSGVHALAQVAHFSTSSGMTVDKILLGLNALLPDDIVVTRVEEVRRDFSALSCAKAKAYRYVILNRRYPSALLKDKVYFCHFPLNIGLMRREARYLLGRHDFRAFCASGSGAKTTIRTITKISIKKIAYDPLFLRKKPEEKSLIVIDVQADGFLYNMVRNIVGTLIEVGRGRFPAGSLKRILASGQRKFAGPTVPARGLYLIAVRYK